MPPAGLVKVNLLGTLASGKTRWASGFWLNSPTLADGPNSAAAVKGAMDASNMTDAILDCMNVSDLWQRIDVYGYNGSPGASYQDTIQVNQPGTANGSNPKATACVVTLYTALASRSGRGRSYIPATGLTIGGNDGLFPGAPVIQLALAFRTAQGNADDPLPFVVYSPTDGVSRPVTRISCDLIPDHQERREKGLSTVRV